MIAWSLLVYPSPPFQCWGVMQLFLRRFWGGVWQEEISQVDTATNHSTLKSGEMGCPENVPELFPTPIVNHGFHRWTTNELQRKNHITVKFVKLLKKNVFLISVCSMKTFVLFGNLWRLLFHAIYWKNKINVLPPLIAISLHFREAFFAG